MYDNEGRPDKYSFFEINQETKNERHGIRASYIKQVRLTLKGLKQRA
jgi:hypothetical protein